MNDAEFVSACRSIVDPSSAYPRQSHMMLTRLVAELDGGGDRVAGYLEARAELAKNPPPPKPKAEIKVATAGKRTKGFASPTEPTAPPPVPPEATTAKKKKKK